MLYVFSSKRRRKRKKKQKLRSWWETMSRNNGRREKFHTPNNNNYEKMSISRETIANELVFVHVCTIVCTQVLRHMHTNKFLSQRINYHLVLYRLLLHTTCPASSVKQEWSLSLPLFRSLCESQANSKQYYGRN